jgi:response regulator RpfG family c-di-GMP phosphodiesterase
MTEQNLPRVLCVDDEEKLLKAIQRSLHKRCEIHTAESGQKGLEILAEQGPFEVVVSDMRMPGMNGAEFLRHCRQQAPDTVRLLLTGFADMDTVVTAVNEGYIYRFIGKPCTGQVLYDAIMDGVKQHQLLVSEKVLLERTLKGCIKAMTEILALAAPAAFGRATRICHLALVMAQEMDFQATWQIEVAALLSQIACITLPPDTVLKYYQGKELTQDEAAMVARMPEVTETILAGIPRLEEVLAILRERDLDYAPEVVPDNVATGKDITAGARILRVANDLEALQASGQNSQRCLDILRVRKGCYDPVVLKAYEQVNIRGGLDFRVRGLTVRELRTGLLLADDVELQSGVMLVPAGQAITVGMIERLKNFSRGAVIKEPIWVQVPEEEVPAVQPAGSTLDLSTPVATGQPV